LEELNANIASSRIGAFFPSPADYSLGQIRHLYPQLLRGEISPKEASMQAADIYSNVKGLEK
jgi:hypothetical protein